MLALPVWAQEPREQAGTLAQRSRNPFADSINLPATLSLGFGVGPRRETEPTLNFEPRIPLGGTDEWRFLTRSNVSILHVHDPDETTGLGDIDVSLFLTPEHTTTWVWGVGPIVRFPTATDRSLGSGKWSAGPTAGRVYVPGPWINGIVASHLWSFAGPRSREDVSQTQAELLVSYTFRNDWYMQTAPTLSYDWRAPRGQGWTIPVGADIGRSFKIGAQGISLQIGAYYNVKEPTGTAEWTLDTQISWFH